MKRLFAGAMATALLTLPTAAVLANGEHPEGGFGWHHGGCGWGGMILGPIIMIVVVAAIVALVVLLARWLGVGAAATPRRAALDILEERFARGEIDKDEFEERRRTLDG